MLLELVIPRYGADFDNTVFGGHPQFEMKDGSGDDYAVWPVIGTEGDNHDKMVWDAATWKDMWAEFDAKLKAPCRGNVWLSMPLQQFVEFSDDDQVEMWMNMIDIDDFTPVRIGYVPPPDFRDDSGKPNRGATIYLQSLNPQFKDNCGVIYLIGHRIVSHHFDIRRWETIDRYVNVLIDMFSSHHFLQAALTQRLATINTVRNRGCLSELLAKITQDASAIHGLLKRACDGDDRMRKKHPGLQSEINSCVSNIQGGVIMFMRMENLTPKGPYLE